MPTILQLKTQVDTEIRQQTAANSISTDRLADMLDAILDKIGEVESPTNTAPSITSHPSNSTITQGQTLSLSVTAIGTAPLSYQWRRGGVNISGQTSATLNMSNAQPVDTGSYTCVVTNSVGSVTSNAASVTVNATTASYTHSLQFDFGTQSANSGINGTVSAANATIQFEFNGLASTVGLPGSMNIYVAGNIKMVIDYPDDYAGDAFRFTDTTGVTYSGVFTNGNVNF